MLRFCLDEYLHGSNPIIGSDVFLSKADINVPALCRCCFSEVCMNQSPISPTSSRSLLSFGDHLKLLPSVASNSQSSTFNAFKYGEQMDLPPDCEQPHASPAMSLSDICVLNEEEGIKEIRVPIHRNHAKYNDNADDRDDDDRPKFARFRDKKYICDACDRSFTLKQNVAQHYFLYHNPKDVNQNRTIRESCSRFQCTKCDRIFTKLEKALKHELREHSGGTLLGNKRRYPCIEPGCAKIYATQTQLTEHVNVIHKQLRPYKCERCELTFGRQGGLRRHVTMVHENQLFSCPYEDCDHPGYKCSKALTAHIRSKHTFIRPYQCLHCEKKFVRNNDLKVHELTHSLGSSYACNKCGTKFKRQIYLSKHMKKCTGEKRSKSRQPSVGAESTTSEEAGPKDTRKRRPAVKKNFIKLKKSRATIGASSGDEPIELEEGEC